MTDDAHSLDLIISSSTAILAQLRWVGFRRLDLRTRVATSEVEALRQGLWSFLHGFILLQSSRPDYEWVPSLLDRSLNAMIRGSIRQRPGTSEQGNSVC